MAFGLAEERRFWVPHEAVDISPDALIMVRAPNVLLSEMGRVPKLAAALITALQDAQLDPRERAMAITHVQTAALIARL